jgi:hypothetical protein
MWLQLRRREGSVIALKPRALRGTRSTANTGIMSMTSTPITSMTMPKARSTLTTQAPVSTATVHTTHAHIHSQESEGSDRPWKLATGLGLIFGLTGFAYGFTARQQRA